MGYTHIIHIADIHIRTGNKKDTRYDEYQSVFKNLLQEVSIIPSVKNKTALFVICGDIFHNKNRLDAYSLLLWNELLQGLTKLGTVIIICGNHDYRQECTDIPDLIEAVYALNENHYPCYYLSKTDTYVFDNIEFGLVCIKDTLNSYSTSGLVEELPPFPKPKHNLIPIALFHGTITQSALPNGQLIPAGKGYPLEWFKDYKMLLLGDNHKQQIHTSDWGMTWGYPGSLIQQDMGEPVHGHGYILWDIDKQTATAHHIYNDYGRLKVKILQDEIYVRTDSSRFAPFDEKVYLPWFPKKPVLTVVGYTGDERPIYTKFKEANIEPSEIYTTLALQQEAYEAEDKSYELTNLNHPSKWLEYIQSKDESLAQHLQQNSWLEYPEHILMEMPNQSISPELLTQIKKVRTKIQDMIEIYKKNEVQHTTTSKITLKHMTWSWVFSYGQNNWFNFETMEGQIAILNGQNATGKSAFIDVLCIGLFGEPNPNRNMNSTKKMTTHFIHNQRPKGVNNNAEAMNISILFELKGERYDITRRYGVDDKTDSRVLTMEIHKIDGDERTLVCSGSKLVNEWMEENCGTIEDLLKTSIVSQLDNHNFFFAKPEEQKKIIDHAVNLNALQKFSDMVHEALVGYNYLLKALTSLLNYKKEDSPTLTKETYLAYTEEESTLKQRIQELEQERDQLTTQCGSFLNNPPTSPVEYYENQMKPIESFERIPLLKHLIQTYPEYPLRNETNLEQLLQTANKKYTKLQSKKLHSGRPIQTLQEQLTILEEWFQKHSKWVEDKTKAQETFELLQQSEEDYVKWKEVSIPKPKHLLQIKDPSSWKEKLQIYKDLLQAKTELQHKIEKHFLTKVEPQRTKEDEATWKQELQNYKDQQAKYQEHTLEECQKNLEDTKKYRDQQTKYIQKRTTEEYELKRLQEQTASIKDYLKYENCQDVVPTLEKLTRIKELLADTNWEKELKFLTMAKKNKWTHLSQMKQTLKELEESNIQVHLLKAELKQLKEDTVEYPFNPKCSACCSNPLHLRSKQAKERIEQIQEHLSKEQELEQDILHYKNGIEILTMLQQAQTEQKYQDRLTYKEELKNPTQVHEQWMELTYYHQNESAIKKSIEKYYKMVEEIKVLEGSIKKLNKKISQLQNTDETLTYWKQATQTLTFVAQQKSYIEKETLVWKKTKQDWKKEEEWNQVKQELDEESLKLQQSLEQAHIEAYSYWKSMGEPYQQQHEDYESLSLFLASIEDKASLRTALEAELQQQQAYLEWNEKVQTLQKEIESIQYTLYHLELKHLEQQQTIQQAIAWYKYNEVKMSLQSLQTRWMNLTQLIQQYASRNAEREQLYDGLLKDWTERRNLLLKLDETMVGEKGKVLSSNTFKEWIYERYIIPMIEQHVNQFLSEIDSIQFRIEYSAKHLLYYVKDRGNETSFAASSGYQQFVIGLAMRQALSIIGGSGNNLQHMIIDEGFTACDQQNLEKANLILKLLIQRGQYKSIIIVSHLETIKDIIPLKINIERKNAFSTLRYGTPYPTFKYTASRGRGRRIA